eukprot:TRINITY_DN3074_c0_g1_i2.p1 TRINITY_DN3074_c0_g1~~TRINITY_DN3074_c0_g1_i2.p1  ORF type:complete len:166 (-),score=46.69 TRINITY_DN3074_c0_g1_i2:113-610(-)
MTRPGLRSLDRKKTARTSVPKEAPKVKKTLIKKITISKKDKDKVKGLTYLDEIKHAILHNKKTRFTSAIAIINYIAKNYPARAQKYQIRRALEAGVDDKKLVKVKNSYRLSKAEQTKEDKKKKAAKKVAKKVVAKTAPKKVKKAATKKTSATKKTTKKVSINVSF